MSNNNGNKTFSKAFLTFLGIDLVIRFGDAITNAYEKAKEFDNEVYLATQEKLKENESEDK